MITKVAVTAILDLVIGSSLRHPGAAKEDSPSVSRWALLRIALNLIERRGKIQRQGLPRPACRQIDGPPARVDRLTDRRGDAERFRKALEQRIVLVLQHRRLRPPQLQDGGTSRRRKENWFQPAGSMALSAKGKAKRR
jgi:hypothetical protein